MGTDKEKLAGITDRKKCGGVNKMRVLILQGSFKGDKGITGMVVNSFVKGLEKAGTSSEIKVEYLKELKIEQCRGCFACWLKTPGNCCIKDDMEWVIEEYRSSDIIIAATPVYIDSMSSLLKKAWERLLPVMEPYFEYDGTWVKHRVRNKSPKGLFVISTCAMPEPEQFDALLQTFRRTACNFGMNFLGQLLRPEAHSLTFTKKYGSRINEVLEGIERCGEEFGTNLCITAEALSEAQRSIMESPEDFVELNNAMWDRMKAR